jgi:hypothetical protein
MSSSKPQKKPLKKPESKSTPKKNVSKTNKVKAKQKTKNVKQIHNESENESDNEPKSESDTDESENKSSESDGESNVEPIQKLLSMSQFNTKATKKKIVAKDLQITENDSKDEIIRKLILSNQYLREELNEFKIYVDGTFCTSAVHNRFADEVEKRFDDMTSQNII